MVATGPVRRYTRTRMSKLHKYLVTTDADTGEVIRVEQLGSAGDLTEVAPETLGALKVAAVVDGAVREPDAAQAEQAPGVFISGELPGVDEEAPGIFVSGELPEVDGGAPGVFFNAELAETRH